MLYALENQGCTVREKSGEIALQSVKSHGKFRDFFFPSGWQPCPFSGGLTRAFFHFLTRLRKKNRLQFNIKPAEEAQQPTTAVISLSGVV